MAVWQRLLSRFLSIGEMGALTFGGLSSFNAYASKNAARLFLYIFVVIFSSNYQPWHYYLFYLHRINACHILSKWVSVWSQLPVPESPAFGGVKSAARIVYFCSLQPHSIIH